MSESWTNATLKWHITEYLIKHGTTGKERLRRSVETRACKPGVTFGRILFGQLMQELEESGEVLRITKNHRTRYFINER